MILIIGAGIAGVTLARSLLQHNVPFRIFEQQAEYKRQGFGLTLREDTVWKLLPLLRIDEPDFRESVAVDRKHGRSNTFLVDTTSGEHFGAASYKEGYATKDFRTNRERLRKIILGDVTVEYGHQLKGFQRRAAGVVAHFEDGLEVEGDVLVAADGVHSFIRKTLLPQCVPQDWNGVMVNGTHRYSIKEWNEKLAPTMGDSTVYPGFSHQAILAPTVYDTDWNSEKGYVDVSWCYSRRRRGEHDPLHVPFSDPHFDKFHPSSALWDEIGGLSGALVEPFKTVFGNLTASRDPTIQHQLVSLLIPKPDLVEKLEHNGVIFIGDSVHDWSNHAGTAANAAIQDALALGTVFAQGCALTSFYEERYPSWLSSYERNGQDFEALHRPQEEWQRLLAEQRAAQPDHTQRL